MEKQETRLRSLLARRKILVAPGAYDGLSARIIESSGFEAVYVTGYGLSASVLGKPDTGLLTQTEMVSRIAAIAEAVSLPVIADGDTGYGNAVNVFRTVREYEKAGAACIQLEDQVAPKKCGHMLGREVIPAQEMAGKIRAACDARRNDDFLIMARTDARTAHGIEEALERGKLYEEAGADILFIESPETVEEMKRITSSFRVPVLANMVEHGRTPFLNVGELEEIGYDIAIFPVGPLYAAAKALQNVLGTLKRSGSTAGCVDRMIPFGEFNELMDLDAVREMEKKYSTGRNGIWKKEGEDR
jgi:carboxyvinyl-carboxyphosphonate phosphorylmutase